MRHAATCPPAYPPPIGEGRLLTEDELAASLAHTLLDWDGKQDLWLFLSLIHISEPTRPIG